jgi:hypothetical protein
VCGETTRDGGQRRAFFLPLFRGHDLKMFSAMRFLWAYLLVVIVFAFGFLCASAFSAGED